MDKKYILFDLDGTLTDSNLGITRCVQYALLDQGIDEQDMGVLQEYIGPALDDSFARQHGLTKEQTVRAVAKYRERYADIGIFENEVYDGITDCLAKLKSAGKILSEYFDVVTGAELSGARKQKVQVIEETFNRLCDNVLKCGKTHDVLIEIKADSVMVGDRNQDVNGAHQAEIECIGVRYGYAKPDELEEAGADYIVEDIAELTELILS
jgi:phosphoglycolate phosphatase